MNTAKAQSTKASKSTKIDTHAAQPSATDTSRQAEASAKHSSNLQEAAGRVRGAEMAIKDAEVFLTRIVTYIDHPAGGDDQDAREALARAFDSLHCAELILVGASACIAAVKS